MLAAGLTLLLFFFWWFLGYAVISVLRRGHLLQNMLLAPAIGTSVCVMFVFWLNRAGIPAGKFGPILGAFLLLGAAVLWWKGRIVVPFRRYLPFGVVFAFSFLLVGWPMFKYGFNWLSISNDDMANYSLTAQRIYRYGYFERLPQAELLKNIDISAYYVAFADAGTRMGSDMLLAFVMSLTRLSPHQIFMPVILSLHLCLMSASGALLLRHHRLRGWTLMALVILGCSAEFTVGTIYQLIAQVFGLSLLAACAVLLMTPRESAFRGSVFKHAALIALVFSASMIVYSEMMPFLALACFLCWGYQLLRTRSIPEIRTYLVAGGIAILFLNSYGPAAIRYMTSQARAGSGHFSSVEDSPVLFPYFLLPSGLAQFWGIAPFNIIPSEPLLSAGILLGGILLIGSFLISVREALRGVPSAFVSVSMFLAAIVLAFKESDYGLFKLAMFIQPFLIPTLVSAWMRISDSKRSERFA